MQEELQEIEENMLKLTLFLHRRTGAAHSEIAAMDIFQFFALYDLVAQQQ